MGPDRRYTANMTLFVRTQRRQQAIEGRQHIIDGNGDDVAVADGDTRGGRICRHRLPGGFRWSWFLQTLVRPGGES